MHSITMYIHKLEICVQGRYQIGYQLLIEYPNIIGIGKTQNFHISAPLHRNPKADTTCMYVCN